MFDKKPLFNQSYYTELGSDGVVRTVSTPIQLYSVKRVPQCQSSAGLPAAKWLSQIGVD